MKEKIAKVVEEAVASLSLHIKNIPEIKIDRTRDEAHGDFATNIALVLAKDARQNPRMLAQALIEKIDVTDDIEKVEIAGPGFINFFLSKNAKFAVIKSIFDQKDRFGYGEVGANKRINLEFVSANPTGPLHVGHGRGAAFGATVANLLETQGYKVDKEYYVNDAGRQMHVLAVSVWLRYLSLFGDLPSFPRAGYKGEYVIDIAKALQKEHGDVFAKDLASVFADLPNDELDKEIYIDALVQNAQTLLGEHSYSTIFDAAVESVLNDIREDLTEFGVKFDNWFSEASLVNSGRIDESIKTLQERGFIYKKNGALWFAATKLGDEKDRVVVRENGITTYFASDIAYHLDKYKRGYDKIIDVFGADHHGYLPRIKAFLQAENLDVDKFNVLLVQFAILYRGKIKLQMSTRSGEFVTLRELREEVGNDATRFFYIMRKNDQHLDFDLDLAKSESSDNPIYYIQYAHARICSVMRQLDDKGFEFNEKEGFNNLNLLSEPQEQQLIRRMRAYSDTLERAALNYEPHSLAHYLQDLANDFHGFYNAHQFLVDDAALRNARLCLILAVKQLLANGLILLGVSAPDTM
ncbi:MAG: arginine--tRNA ligase [Gammaproteobacteria bacterium]|nr:arginine--tRNA ligase [Gammaproteobacteria bacterium]